MKNGGLILVSGWSNENNNLNLYFIIIFITFVALYLIANTL